MKNKYLSYTIEQLLDDNKFIRWVLLNDDKEYWERLLNADEEFAQKAQNAEKIIEGIISHENSLSEEDVYEIWANVVNYADKQDKVKPIVISKFKKVFAIAASLLVILSIGTLLYFISSDNSGYQFSNKNLQVHGTDARIYLGSTDSVVFNSDYSQIFIQNDGIKISLNDSVIKKQNSSADKSINEKSVEEKVEIIIPYGKKSELILSDGTKIWLNAGTRFAFPKRFSNRNREVYLDGEAYFEVAENSEKPFVVTTNKIEVVVLGTHFNVSSYPEDKYFEASLLEGSIELKQINLATISKKKVKLKPGQNAFYSKDSKNISVAYDPQIDDQVAWKNGWLTFSRESLPTVFKKLERYHEITVKFDENYKPTELISGKLDIEQSLDQILLTLTELANVEFRKNGTEVFIKRRN